jgi:hypothetical protein
VLHAIGGNGDGQGQMSQQVSYFCQSRVFRLYTLDSEQVRIQNSHLTANEGYGIRIYAENLHQLDLANVTFSANLTNSVGIVTRWNPRLSSNVTLTPQPGLDGYTIESDYFSVPNGLTLTLQAGTTLMFPTGSYLSVEGHLDALGTTSNPVTLTSLLDSGPGQWDGLSFGR